MTSETWEKKHPDSPMTILMSRPNRVGLLVIIATWIFLYFHVISQLFDGLTQFLTSWNTGSVIKISATLDSQAADFKSMQQLLILTFTNVFYFRSLIFFLPSLPFFFH